MNTLPRAPISLRTPSAPVRPTVASRPYAYPERDFGVGYGRSSGYASPRRYALAWAGEPRFRCR